MKIVKSAQKAIDSVEEGAVGVFEDTFEDQIHPDYLVLETAEELAELQTLIRQVEQAEDLETIAALEELEEYVGQACLPSHLRVLYLDGEWKQEPETLLDEEFMTFQQEEDWEWVDAQREHFAKMHNPTPVVPNEPWRDKVLERAIEIATAEGRAPEQADFNTTMIQLHEEVPPGELALLQRDLEAVEAGTSSDPFWVFGDSSFHPEPYCDGCGFVRSACVCDQYVICPACGERVFDNYTCSACGAELTGEPDSC